MTHCWACQPWHSVLSVEKSPSNCKRTYGYSALRWFGYIGKRSNFIRSECSAKYPKFVVSSSEVFTKGLVLPT